jgi:hypothetical protein
MAHKLARLVYRTTKPRLSIKLDRALTCVVRRVALMGDISNLGIHHLARVEKFVDGGESIVG